MKFRIFSARSLLVSVVVAISLTGCVQVPPSPNGSLVGAWRGHVQFVDGAFAEVKDLEFLYVFSAGGTMTESSNYDGAPPVPPAYGIWREVADRVYEAKYEYFWTKPPEKFEDLSKGCGWTPGGRGVLTQKITLSKDRRSFDSSITYEVFDQAGKPTEKESHASAKAKKLSF